MQINIAEKALEVIGHLLQLFAVVNAFCEAGYLIFPVHLLDTVKKLIPKTKMVKLISSRGRKVVITNLAF
jgi:hypothetical protein